MLKIKGVGTPPCSFESEDEVKIEPCDESDEEDSNKGRHPESILLPMVEPHPDRDGADKEAVKEKQAGAVSGELEKGVPDRVKVWKDHFFPSVSLCVRKSTWFLTFLSILILLCITSEA